MGKKPHSSPNFVAVLQTRRGFPDAGIQKIKPGVSVAARFLIACVAMSSLSAGVYSQEKTIAPLDQAKAQLRRKEFAPAIQSLRNYVNASTANVGDKNVDDAKKMLVQASSSYAQTLESSGDYLQAASVLLDTASVSALSDQSDALLRDAKTLMQRCYKTAVSKNEIQKAFDVADAFAQRFPSEAPLVAPEERVKLRISALNQARNSSRSSFALSEYRRLKATGVTKEQFQAGGLIESELVARYCDELFRRGWYLQAASFAQNELSVGAASGDTKEKLQKLSERSLSAYFDSCLVLGNAGMIKDAAKAYGDPANTASEKSKVARMKTATDALSSKASPKELAFAAKFIEGKGTWSDDGTGYVVSNPVQIGNCGHVRGGESKGGDVVIQPGFVLANGVLRASQGKLEIKGSPDRPVVFKNVSIECDYTASVTASFALFIDCKFVKTGGWFWKGGFSSKWDFSDCLIVDSAFNSLTKIDYGIKLQRCTFVQVAIPDRSLTDDAAKDNTGLFHDQWNTISDCQFYQCKVPPSLLWANGKSAFLDCTINGASTFASAKPLQAGGFLPKDDSSFEAAISAATKTKGAGKVDYSFSVLDMSKLKPSPLWHLVPSLTDVTEQSN